MMYLHLIILDSIPPKYNSVSHDSTTAGEITHFSINISDNQALSPNGQYIFSTNNTGSWVNDTAVNFTANPQTISITKTLVSTTEITIGYKWYFNDSSFTPNTNSTSIYTLKTTESEEDDDNDGGGSSRGGGGDEPVILKPTSSQIQNGYQNLLREEYQIRINLSTRETYLAKINDINRFTKNISFSVNSTNYSVGLNETIKINLDNDSYYDLQAFVVSITIYNSTIMSFKEIHEEIPAKKEAEVVENVLNENTNEQEEKADQEKETVKPKKVFFYFFAGIIALAVVITAFFLFKRIKKQR